MIFPSVLLSILSWLIWRNYVWTVSALSIELPISSKIIHAIDAADLLECSKQRSYIFLDKTEQISNKKTTNLKELLPLESIYLSSHFFGIIESIAGSSGNFVNDAISGLQINRVVDTLKETQIEIFLGSFQDSPTSAANKSGINLSCIYDNSFPSLTKYDKNNFCEYTWGLSEKFILISEESICRLNSSSKIDFNGKFKYFNVLSSLKVPILNFVKFEKEQFSLFNSQNMQNNQANLNRYLIFSNELGLSLFINFGVGFFGEPSRNKYYLLLKVVPPSSFWSKDEGFEHWDYNTVKSKVKKNDFDENSNICKKYENNFYSIDNNSISVFESNKSEDNLTIKCGKITYLNIDINNSLTCIGKYSLKVKSKTTEKPSIMKVFDNNKDEFTEMEIIEYSLNHGKLEYIYKFTNSIFLSRILMVILNECGNGIGVNSISIAYTITCNISENALFSEIFPFIFNSIRRISSKEAFGISIISKKVINHSNGIIYLIILITLFLSVPIFGLCIALSKKMIRHDRSNIDHLKIPLTKSHQIKLDNTLTTFSSQNTFESYLMRNYTHESEIHNSKEKIPLRLKKELLSPSLSPISHSNNVNIINDIQSPDQIELYTAISNNVSEAIEFNTDTSSSPSTIKSITFKY
ncbi:hypothetical protein HWI79_463 [Cryptosporidium felis]|nr:hypothetical protein HWI79_463 [Cryptosporidium felis]